MIRSRFLHGIQSCRCLPQRPALSGLPIHHSSSASASASASTTTTITHHHQRCLLHSSATAPANPLPIVATGPPPAPPQPAVSDARERLERRRRQADILRQHTATKRSDLRGGGAGGGKSSATSFRPGEALKRRFWRDVHVQRTEEGLHSIHLDSRAVRIPNSKLPLYVPASKPHLATAIALEWDSLTSAQQALKSHLVPLTSLTARALDIVRQDVRDTEAGVELGAEGVEDSGRGAGRENTGASGGVEGVEASAQEAESAASLPTSRTAPSTSARREIVNQMMRYLDTDTLLCWESRNEEDSDGDGASRAEAQARAIIETLGVSNANGPTPASSVIPGAESIGTVRSPRSILSSNLTSLSSSSSSPSTSNSPSRRSRPSLRDEQERTAAPIIAWLTTHVWPGVTIQPALGEDSIVPAPQPEITRAVVRGWLSGLGAWELAALERAALATKSLCIAARLVCEWSENFPRITEVATDTGGREEKGAAPGAVSSSGSGSGSGSGTGPDPAAAAAGSGAGGRFDIDAAAHACSTEVRWQVALWGEVEDSHDVEREDLRRQLGSAVLLVCGTGE